MAPDFGIERALLLQGPMGPFFRRFADELKGRGVSVTKVNLNAGDALYFRGPEALSYRGSFEAWPAYVEALLRERNIQAIYLFGDGRPYHRKAIEVARRLGARVFVFEEGYLRPDWITLEEHGVNGHSRMPRDPAFYRAYAETAAAVPRAEHVGPTFKYGGWYSTLYSLALTFGALAYPRYRHHRPLHAIAEAFYWVRGGVRKLWFGVSERGALERLVGAHDRKYFVAALQVHCDYQLAHSAYQTVEAFIEDVVRSFAEHAAKDELLVIKHHPMDRPYREYGGLMRRLAASSGLRDRLVYVHDLHLPTLLSHARGAVMINSTVGLQSIHLGTPVKVLGTAIYDMPGLTHQGQLGEFWKDPGTVDKDLYQAFRTYLLYVNQVNGSFYKPLRHVERAAGMRWFGDPSGRPSL